MLIYAIDPGKSVAGYAIFDTDAMDDSPDLWARAASGMLDCGTFTGSASKYLHRQMNDLHDKLGQILRRGVSLHVDQVGVSGPPAGDYRALIEVPSWAGTYGKNRNPQSVAGLNRWIGATAASLSLHDVDVDYVEAQKVPKNKRELAVLAALRLAKKKEPDPGSPPDVFDALYLGVDWIVNELWERAA